ncbi:hypothetical protein M413DRAFT_31226 [Hebeloma cylindrosporum]|uniref:Uncharacterized protein n=1 Tax=Hebeloma cylindrosporum TaxID=76867 RepID=A0A0C3C070_HEBCY|nr:hypothetical protein M413DRAFT_31226 [Hebeloma cylindrosporum h7]
MKIADLLNPDPGVSQRSPPRAVSVACVSVEDIAKDRSAAEGVVSMRIHGDASGTPSWPVVPPDVHSAHSRIQWERPPSPLPTSSSTTIYAITSDLRNSRSTVSNEAVTERLPYPPRHDYPFLSVGTHQSRSPIPDFPPSFPSPSSRLPPPGCQWEECASYRVAVEMDAPPGPYSAEWSLNSPLPTYDLPLDPLPAARSPCTCDQCSSNMFSAVHAYSTAAYTSSNSRSHTPGAVWDTGSAISSASREDWAVCMTTYPERSMEGAERPNPMNCTERLLPHLHQRRRNTSPSFHGTVDARYPTPRDFADLKEGTRNPGLARRKASRRARIMEGHPYGFPMKNSILRVEDADDYIPDLVRRYPSAGPSRIPGRSIATDEDEIPSSLVTGSNHLPVPFLSIPQLAIAAVAAKEADFHIEVDNVAMSPGKRARNTDEQTMRISKRRRIGFEDLESQVVVDGPSRGDTHKAPFPLHDRPDSTPMETSPEALDDVEPPSQTLVKRTKNLKTRARNKSPYTKPSAGDKRKSSRTRKSKRREMGCPNVEIQKIVSGPSDELAIEVHDQREPTPDEPLIEEPPNGTVVGRTGKSRTGEKKRGPYMNEKKRKAFLEEEEFLNSFSKNHGTCATTLAAIASDSRTKYNPGLLKKHALTCRATRNKIVLENDPRVEKGSVMPYVVVCAGCKKPVNLHKTTVDDSKGKKRRRIGEKNEASPKSEQQELKEIEVKVKRFRAAAKVGYSGKEEAPLCKEEKEYTQRKDLCKKLYAPCLWEEHKKACGGSAST